MTASTVGNGEQMLAKTLSGYREECARSSLSFSLTSGGLSSSTTAWTIASRHSEQENKWACSSSLSVVSKSRNCFNFSCEGCFEVERAIKCESRCSFDFRSIPD